MRAGKLFAVLAPALGAALAQGGCAATDPLNHVEGGIGYRNVMVGSGDASAFLYIPADQWAALGPDEAARRAAMLGDHSFSPVKVNAPVKMTIGMRYVVIPLCSGQPRWDKAIRPVIEDQKAVAVSC